MSFRTVVISNRCKLTYKNGYMVVRSDELTTENIYKHITSQKVTTLFLESVECYATYKYEKKLVVDSDFYEFVC